MKEKPSIKQFQKAGGVVLFIIMLLISLKMIFQVDLKETIKTRYSKVDDTTKQIIETSCFKIKTPKSWIHISSGFGFEIDPIGYFLTTKGRIFYEYGLFGPSYETDDEISSYKVEKRKIGRFIVNIAKNNLNETGIAITPQHEMNRTMSFYMDKSITENLEAILEGIYEIEFKEL